MANFILKEGDYDRLPERLLRVVPGFEASEAYQIIKADRKLPGVVCGALARYLVTVQRKATRSGEAGSERQTILSAIYRAIEDLATSEDPDTQNAVVVDILESLASEDDLLEAIKRGLLPRSRVLYDRWID